MNAFYEHHQNSIRFGYRCFDRILLNGLIQPFQQPERVVGFFSTGERIVPLPPPHCPRNRRSYLMYSISIDYIVYSGASFADPHFRGRRPGLPPSANGCGVLQRRKL